MKTINDYTLNEIMASIDISLMKNHILPLREDIQEVAINLIQKFIDSLDVYLQINEQLKINMLNMNVNYENLKSIKMIKPYFEYGEFKI